ncbi:MAG: hypothetical protein ACI9R3_006061 [Verrucomicrobiales bacterium]|jgi:hypothetical protein
MPVRVFTQKPCVSVYNLCQLFGGSGVISKSAFLLFSAFILTNVGCGQGESSPTTVAVKGTVLYKGDPVAGANVNFYTEGAPRAAYGVTNDKGEFELTTFSPKDGAVAGDHVSTVSKAGETANQPSASAEPPSPESLAGDYRETAEKANEAENKLPAKYASQDTSPLKFTVTEAGPNEFILELTD